MAGMVRQCTRWCRTHQFHRLLFANSLYICTPTASAEATSGDAGLYGAAPPHDADATASLAAASPCAMDSVPTYEVQGQLPESELLGQTVALMGVVSFVSRDAESDASGISGFHLEDPVGDGDPSTSDAVFVSAVGIVDESHLDRELPEASAIGSLVRVEGTVVEVDGETQVVASQVTDCGSAELKPPLRVELPFDLEARQGAEPIGPLLETLEGMRVELDQSLVIAGVHDWVRYGELLLMLPPLANSYTQTSMPDVERYSQYEQALARRSILLDDGSSQLYPDLRTGIWSLIPGAGIAVGNEVLPGMVAVVRQRQAASAQAAAGYRLVPLGPLSVTSQEHPAAPPAPTAGVRIVSVNLNNLFKDGGDAGACYPSFTADDCRGRNSPTERRQHVERAVAALSLLRADVVVASEVQNDFGDESGTWASFVQELNAAAEPDGGCRNYVAVDPETFLGTDAIAVAIAHCAERLELTQAPRWPERHELELVSPQASDAYYGPAANRVPLLATFKERPSGHLLSVVAVHLKSKLPGSLEHLCTGPTLPADCDAHDGQGYWNSRRLQGALGLGGWLRDTHQEPGTLLIIGDFNAYAQEDPLRWLEGQDTLPAHEATLPGAPLPARQGLHLLTRSLQPDAYSYVYDGRVGVLDHAFIDRASIAFVHQVGVWNINSGTSSLSDHRFSDHDPLFVDLVLSTSETCDCGAETAIVGGPGDDVLVGTPGPDVICGYGGNDVILGIEEDDCVSGGLGDDWIWSDGRRQPPVGPGADTIVLNEGSEFGCGTVATNARCVEVADGSTPHANGYQACVME